MKKPPSTITYKRYKCFVPKSGYKIFNQKNLFFNQIKSPAGDTLVAEELSVGRMTGGVGGVGPGWVDGVGRGRGGGGDLASDTTSVRGREGPALFSSHCRPPASYSVPLPGPEGFSSYSVGLLLLLVTGRWSSNRGDRIIRFSHIFK